MLIATPICSFAMMESTGLSCLDKGKTSSTMVPISQTLIVLSIDEVTAWFHFPSIRELILLNKMMCSREHSNHLVPDDPAIMSLKMFDELFTGYVPYKYELSDSSNGHILAFVEDT